MSTYLDKLIEGVKGEIDREHERVGHITSHSRKTERLAIGMLRRLEQRLEVLEQLKAAEKVRSRIPSSIPRGRFARGQ